MLEIKTIDHVVLRVQDVARMVRFYGEVLGCPVERELADFGSVQLRAGAALSLASALLCGGLAVWRQRRRAAS